MQPIYRTSYEITGIHLDRYGRVKPSVLLYFAQEAAGGHCNQLALDWDTLAKRHLFWAVIRHKVQVSRLPVAGDTVTVETWPMPTTRVAFPRSTIGYDQHGREVFRSISIWVLMDTDTRAMVLPGKSGIALSGTVRGDELAQPANLHPQILKNKICRQVSYTDLDRNGHMNNTRYMDWIDDLLPSAFHADHCVREFTICYHCEATEQQQMELSWELSDGPCLRVDAHRICTDVPDKQARVFSAQVLF